MVDESKKAPELVVFVFFKRYKSKVKARRPLLRASIFFFPELVFLFF